MRFLDDIDELLVFWMKKHALVFLRLSLGIVFLWFGVLKFFPGLSPAEGLAAQTITTLSLGLLTPETAVLILAIWESLIGLGLIAGVWMRITLGLLFLQMVGTFTPILLFPGEVFTHFPYALTLEGQYIIKNIVIISAAFVIGAHLKILKQR